MRCRSSSRSDPRGFVRAHRALTVECRPDVACAMSDRSGHAAMPVRPPGVPLGACDDGTPDGVLASTPRQCRRAGHRSLPTDTGIPVAAVANRPRVALAHTKDPPPRTAAAGRPPEPLPAGDSDSRERSVNPSCRGVSAAPCPARVVVPVGTVLAEVVRRLGEAHQHATRDAEVLAAATSSLPLPTVMASTAGREACRTQWCGRTRPWRC